VHESSSITLAQTKSAISPTENQLTCFG